MTRGDARLVLDARMATDGGIGTYLQNVFPRVASARSDWSFTVLGDPATLQALGWPAIPNVAVRQCRSTYYTMSEQIELPFFDFYLKDKSADTIISALKHMFDLFEYQYGFKPKVIESDGEIYSVKLAI